jgi:hypothetical protein
MCGHLPKPPIVIIIDNAPREVVELRNVQHGADSADSGRGPVALFGDNQVRRAGAWAIPLDGLWSVNQNHYVAVLFTGRPQQPACATPQRPLRRVRESWAVKGVSRAENAWRVLTVDKALPVDELKPHDRATQKQRTDQLRHHLCRGVLNYRLHTEFADYRQCVQISSIAMCQGRPNPRIIGINRGRPRFQFDGRCVFTDRVHTLRVYRRCIIGDHQPMIAEHLLGGFPEHMSRELAAGVGRIVSTATVMGPV